MEEKINVAELLKDCPQGMELDCTVYDECILDSILEGELYPIKIRTPEGAMLLTKYGSFSCNKHSKCIIFPKGKTTWEGFQRPFEPGDIVITDSNEHAFIYSGENDKFWECYCGVYCGTRNICINSKQWSDRQHKLRLATKKEIETLFQVIKDNGYQWNPETKTLEKLDKPKFKVGDKVSWNYDTYKQALLTFGCHSQRMMCMEECGELVDALAKYDRGRNNSADVITELADVSIMVEQMAEFFGREAYGAERERKMMRLREIIEREKK